MVRSVIPDSDDDSGEESPFNVQSTIPPAIAHQQSPLAPPALPNRDNANLNAGTTQDDASAHLILGTGSTDSAVFQQIYNQHQLSTDATLPTPVSQPNIPIILDHSTPTLSIPNVGHSTPTAPQKINSFSTSSSSNTIKKLKPSKTNINDSSFISPEEASKKDNRMKRAKSMKSYPHTIEGSQEDITVNVADTGSYTVLSQKSNTYRKVAANDEILAVENSKPKDVYEFPGSSEPKQITKKMGAKTTMDIAKEKMKTYGKVRRSKTMVPPSSSPSAPNPSRDERRRDEGDGEVMDMDNTRLPSSPPVQVQEQQKAPRRSLAENIQRKKEEKAAAAAKEKEAPKPLEGEATVEAKAKSPIKTNGKVKRSKTGVASSSTATAVDSAKRSMDDSSLVDKHRQRKSDVYVDEDVPFGLLQAKRFQRRKSTEAASTVSKSTQGEVVVLSSSQDDPVDQIPDTVITPTASMPDPLLKSSTNTVLVPATKSSNKSSASNEGNAKAAPHIDSNTSVIVDSNVSVVKATKSSGNKSSSAGHDHPRTPKLLGFDSSQEHADAVRSVQKKVAEFVNSPAIPVPAATRKESSSPLAISFDKGLVGKSIVVVTELTNSQKEQYVAVSVTGSEGDGHEWPASLPHMMSPARVQKWSGASSTVANSTFKDRTPGGDSEDRRAPTMEPLSSQPRPSSRRANKRSMTGLEDTTPSKRRGRSASVHSDAPPSSEGSDVVVKSSSRKVRRSKTMAASDEPAESSSQPRRTHIVKTLTTYEKLKDPDAGPPSFPALAPFAEVNTANTQSESSRGMKRKYDVADRDISPAELKSQLETQEELDFEMAKKLQEEMDKDDAEPETRAKRRAPSKVDSPRPEPEPISSQEVAGLPPPEMYKPRLSSRRSKSLSAKADPNAPELFVDGLPRGRKGKGKKAASQKEAVVAEAEKAVEKENVEPAKEATQANINAPSIVDTPMNDAPAPLDDEEGLFVATEMPKSFFSKKQDVEEAAAPAKVYAVPKKVSRASSKPSAAAAAAQDEDDDEEVVSPKKRGRGAKAVIDTDESVDGLSVMDVDEEPVVPKTTARGRAAAKRTASLKAAAKSLAKSKEVVDTEDDNDDEELPVKPAARLSRAKSAVQETLNPAPKSKEIVDTDGSEDEEEPTEAVSPVKAPPAAPAPVARTPSLKSRVGGVTSKTSTQGFKAPTMTMTRNKSTSVETDVPQTPRKEKERGSREMTPKSTPPGTGTTSHSPLRGGVVPLRVGLSKKTRLPSLLKIIRK